MTLNDNNSHDGTGSSSDNSLDYLDLGQSVEAWINTLPEETPQTSNEEEDEA